MPDGIGKSAKFKPGRIKMIIQGALEIAGDSEIPDEKLPGLLKEVSRIMEREVLLPNPEKKHGWRMTCNRLTTYVYENQGRFAPPPPSESKNHEPSLGTDRL